METIKTTVRYKFEGELVVEVPTGLDDPDIYAFNQGWSELMKLGPEDLAGGVRGWTFGDNYLEFYDAETSKPIGGSKGNEDPDI